MILYHIKKFVQYRLYWFEATSGPEKIVMPGKMIRFQKEDFISLKEVLDDFIQG
ncbi:MAG: hypothetical protein ABFD12_01450 [Syntrophorhabdus sp.]